LAQQQQHPATYNNNKYIMNDQQQRAQALMARADKILKAVDNSYIIKERGHHPRNMPKFKHTEIELGRTLGAGGFGIVNQITAFDLELEEETQTPEPNDKKESAGGAETEKKAETEEGAQPTASTTEGGADYTTATASVTETTKKDQYSPVTTGDGYEDDSHYDIEGARELMQKRCLRRGVTRYALKRLHDDLSDVEKARAMIDLAVEAKYLSVVWHPNIGTFLFWGYLFACSVWVDICVQFF